MMNMDYDELLQRYRSVLVERDALISENERLRNLLNSKPDLVISDSVNPPVIEVAVLASSNETKTLNPSEKIQLFRSLFRGREDVFPKRWQNQKGNSGYSPVCSNEWRDGICMKPKTSCSSCNAQSFAELNDAVIEGHLTGKSVIGLYPLLKDNTSWFLAIDFDGINWEMDVRAIGLVCDEYDIPVVVERSRSGKGAHMWFFFDKPVNASLSRRFGASLLTFTMNRRHELSFASYDRMFPNQDILPKGGFGNLIALPLQKAARANGNSEFIDQEMNPYVDQWGFLSSVRKMSLDEISRLIGILSPGNELGLLKHDDESIEKPVSSLIHKIKPVELPDAIEVVRSNMLIINKKGLSDSALNQIKRLAAFRNPEFYRAQAMRMSTFGKPRIISCSDEDETHIYLPRGCERAFLEMCEGAGSHIVWTDKTNAGRKIDVEFTGELRDDQPQALRKLMSVNAGVLSGTTAFGKTVVALNLIAERKVNTLIIVDKVSLVSQWIDRINQFLKINEPVSEQVLVKKRGRSNNVSIIGQIGAGKDIAGGIIDIAIMQSLNRRGEVKELVSDYGMVIVDECHHLAAFSFEEVLKYVNARYVYGLTATPTRKDGHHPIIFMQCGPICYRDDAIKQAQNRPFEHFVIPCFTPYKLPSWKEEKDLSIQEMYSELLLNEARDEQIIEDVLKCHEQGRNSIILTGRTVHVENLVNKLNNKIPDVISLTGGMGTKATREAIRKLREAPSSTPVVVVATGKFVGEGFDEPRLDTLFLAMPISWKGTLQQYAGRLHRLYEGKKDVRIYDYIDLHINVFEKMYSRRLSGYASIGYHLKGESVSDGEADIIYDKESFLPALSIDLLNSLREIVIYSPKVFPKKAGKIHELLKEAMKKGVKITIITSQVNEYREEIKREIEDTISSFEVSGMKVVRREKIHHKFAIFDQNIIWFGSINILGNASADDSMMRIKNRNVADELIRLL
jgi:superfamily II DNA or RNA helicase